MDAFIFLGMIFAVIIFVMVRGAIEEKRQKKWYEARLREQYGQFPDKEYKEEDFENITRLFAYRHKDYFVDDITWNDLNMNGIFALMNHTQSSSGAEYLYDMLRTPKLEKDEFDELEKHISFFQKEEDKRASVQMKLHELGRSGKFSIFDYIEYLNNLGNCSNKKHILMLAALMGALLLLFYNVVVGVFLLLAVVAVNMVTYLREKSSIQPYLTSFSYIMRLIRCADSLLKTGLEELPDYQQELKQKAAKLAPIRRNYGAVVKMNSSGGNPLEIVVDYINMLTHIDIMRFNHMVCLVKENKEAIYELVEAIGYIDAVISIGAFRESLQFYCVPVFEEGKEVTLCIEDGYHPSVSNPVVNSFTQTRGILVTGSNASGKSTFLKMVAINAILAQTIHTCAAGSYRGGLYKIFSSMALRDDLMAGDSYYIVEIKALKRIMDAAEEISENPLLCFVDEVLRGTNTVERIAASTQIMENLAQKGVYCFAATHDIELTHLLAEKYDNYHFEEDVKDGDVLFSYRLLAGRAQTRNAIKLLKVIGFSDKITECAEDRAQRFIRTGQWT